MKAVKDALEKLRNAGYQITPQREYVLELCNQTDGHFTADDLYDLDRQGEEKLSRATIYNTLHILVEVGYLRELSDVGASRCYEIRHHLHPHARCRSCGKLVDIPVDLKEQVDSWDLPFEIDTIRMTVDGLCESCSKQRQPA